MHRGEGTKKKYFIPEPPQQKAEKDPCPSQLAGEPGAEPASAQAITEQVLRVGRGYPGRARLYPCS